MRGSAAAHFICPQISSLGPKAAASPAIRSLRDASKKEPGKAFWPAGEIEPRWQAARIKALSRLLS
jgi:hypothetical protein